MKMTLDKERDGERESNKCQNIHSQHFEFETSLKRKKTKRKIFPTISSKISPLPNLDVLQALFGALPESEKSKLIHKVDSISKARWMKSITCGAEAELFKDQIPDTVFSEDDHAGVLS